MVQFAATIKINKTGPTVGEYEDLLQKLYQDEGLLMESLVYEEDSKQNLHIHGIINADFKVSYKYLNKRYRCHIYLVPLESNDDITKWNNYINKQKKYQEEIIMENEFKHKYCFIN